MKTIQILVVEDEEKLMRTLEDFLRHGGYQVLKAANGEEALRVFRENKAFVDLILLDLMLPEITGLSVLREIRKSSDVPVIILSAKSAVDDQIQGFEHGADDYITKPYTLKLLKSHIEAVLKRSGKFRDWMGYKKLRVDLAAQRVYWAGKPIETTRREYELLLYFMEHRNMVLSRTAILDAVWGYDYVGDIRTVDTLVKQLRKKLTAECDYIQSVYGVGYIMGGEKVD